MKKQAIRFTDREVPFPRAVKAGNWIFMALASGTGQTFEEPIVAPTFEEQFTHLLEEIKTTLESLGSSMGNVVKSTVYFTNLERDVEKAGEVWDKYFPSDNPNAVAWIGIKDLYPTKPQPPLLVEMTLTAIIPDE